MNKKKIINILLLVLIVIGIMALYYIKKDNQNNKLNEEKILSLMKPISIDKAMEILRNEYGEMINMDRSNIKTINNEYIIEVFVSVEDDEESNNSHNDEEHTHEYSLGIHKVNRYTGDIEFPK